MKYLIEISGDQRDALDSVLRLALSDQEHYMANGSPEADYGNEWPEAAQLKAKEFQMVGMVATQLGLPVLADGFFSLVKLLKAQRREPKQ